LNRQGAKKSNQELFSAFNLLFLFPTLASWRLGGSNCFLPIPKTQADHHCPMRGNALNISQRSKIFG
jgi:hypothetical protein